MKRDHESAAPHVVATAEREGLSERAPGTLVLIGGACSVMGEAFGAFIDRAGARGGGRIVGLTTASSDPRESANAWRADFTEAGARDVAFPLFDRRESPRDREIAAMIADARGIFLGGGDQVKLVGALAGSCTLKAIREAYCRGAVVCGTSAGAAALSELTMAGGETDEDGNLVEQYVGPGFGLLGFGAIVDTHFSQRRRLQRLFVVIAGNTELFGVGIDEDTALVVEGHVGRVVGAGGVTFVDGRDSVRYDNADEVERASQLTLSHLRVGLVGTGHRLDLKARELDALAERQSPES